MTTSREPVLADAVAMWCTDCGIRLRQADIKGWGCPKCGSQGIPCAPDEDVFVEVNWHELQTLCYSAEFWAAQYADSDDELSRKMLMTVRAIARRLEQQWPTMSPLTLGGELADLHDQVADRGIKIGAVEANLLTAPPVLELGPGAVGFARKKET